MDLIRNILDAVLTKKPDDAFCKSLLEQYKLRGGLSKKQLEGLHGKATNYTDLAPGKLATLQAIINKKQQIQRSDKPAVTEKKTEDEIPGLIAEILVLAPAHKRILFMQNRYANGDVFTIPEKDEIKRIHKLLCGRRV